MAGCWALGVPAAVLHTRPGSAVPGLMLGSVATVPADGGTGAGAFTSVVFQPGTMEAPWGGLPGSVGFACARPVQDGSAIRYTHYLKTAGITFSASGSARQSMLPSDSATCASPECQPAEWHEKAIMDDMVLWPAPVQRRGCIGSTLALQTPGWCRCHSWRR